MKLSADVSQQFGIDGYIVLNGFYDVERDIYPIWHGIRNIIKRLCQNEDVVVDFGEVDGEHFDDGYQQLIAKDRKLGGVVYDAVKQLGAFARLASDKRNEEVFKELRTNAEPGFALGGWGIRIDNPNEAVYRTPWHQEYPTQFRSLDGIVFWSPLRKITPAIGPLVVAPGSHAEGIMPVMHESGTPDQSGAYAIRLANEAALSRYETVEPLVDPGDLILMDFLTLHCSGVNSSPKSRWTMQTRWFNFAEPSGVAHHWAGPNASREAISRIHPAIFADSKSVQ